MSTVFTAECTFSKNVTAYLYTVICFKCCIQISVLSSSSGGGGGGLLYFCRFCTKKICWQLSTTPQYSLSNSSCMDLKPHSIEELKFTLNNFAQLLCNIYIYTCVNRSSVFNSTVYAFHKKVNQGLFIYLFIQLRQVKLHKWHAYNTNTI